MMLHRKAVGWLLMGIVVLSLASQTGCGQQVASVAIRPTSTSTPPALQKTVQAQGTTIAQLRRAMAVPTDTPVPAPSDTPVPAPSDTPVPAPSDTPVPEPSATPAPSPIGVWLIQPVAASEEPADAGYQTAMVTVTVKNTSSTVQNLRPLGITLQIKTDAGYLYPLTTTQEGTPMITLNEVP